VVNGYLISSPDSINSELFHALRQFIDTVKNFFIALVVRADLVWPQLLLPLIHGLFSFQMLFTTEVFFVLKWVPRSDT